MKSSDLNDDGCSSHRLQYFNEPGRTHVNSAKLKSRYALVYFSDKIVISNH